MKDEQTAPQTTVPRWALNYLLQHADCDDAGGHQSSEMIAARYHLELAVERDASTRHAERPRVRGVGTRQAARYSGGYASGTAAAGA